MKVLQVLPNLNSGGVERGTVEFARELVKQGHESFVMSNGGRLVAQLESEGSGHIHQPVHRKSLWTLRLVRPVRKLLQELKPDIIHVRSRAPAWIIWLAWRKLPVATRPRLVSTFHGLYSVNFYSAVMAEQSLQDNPVTQAINLGQITRSESACFKAQDGRHICVEYVCTPLQGENSDSNGAVIVFSDITERIEYQTNLAKRNELISLGLDAAGLGSWEWIFEEKIIVWSPTLYRILDMSEGDFSGHLAELKKLIHPDDIEQIRLVDAHAKNSLDVTEFCCRIIKPKGDVIWVTGKYRYFANSQGLSVRARGVLWDSTDETLLQQDNISKTEALKRSNKELDSFAYIASHDLKEPLRGISNYATFLQEDYANVLDADGLGMLQSLVRLAGHMEQLINDLLNYSRLGRTELAYGDVDINAVVTGVLESLWPRLNELNVSVNYATPLPCVYCDSVRIAEVFRNLITNAMKYNDAENKTIALGCNLGAKEYVFYVRDNGIGIAPAFQQRIFEVFKRLHAKTEYGGGSGIGLSIVQKIVVQHGGRLWLESVLNKGTTFYFSLPHPTKN